MINQLMYGIMKTVYLYLKVQQTVMISWLKQLCSTDAHPLPVVDGVKQANSSFRDAFTATVTQHFFLLCVDGADLLTV